MSTRRTSRGSPWRTWRGDMPGGPKPRPPEHGIKIRTVGTTWWGQRWIEALEKSSPEYASRLGRGKTYARTGRVHDLVVTPGEVRASVTGSSSEPYEITIAIPPLDDASWSAAIALLGKTARFSAELLAGQMPKDVDDAFRAVGVSLFPKAQRAKVGELLIQCSCPDFANPCKHVAATHYVLADALDRDPFLLFELRGRTREQVLAAAQQVRGGSTTDDAENAPEAEAGMRLPKLHDHDYDAWRGPMPALRLSFATPVGHAAVIASLGKPASWREKTSPCELLAGIVQSASTQALGIALEPMKIDVSDENER